MIKKIPTEDKWLLGTLAVCVLLAFIGLQNSRFNQVSSDCPQYAKGQPTTQGKQSIQIGTNTIGQNQLEGTVSAKGGENNPQEGWWCVIWPWWWPNSGVWQAFFDFGLVVIGFFQWQMMRRQSSLINKQEITLIGMERAYVFIGPKITVVEDDRDGTTRLWVEFCFMNHGRTPAVIEEIHQICTYVETGCPPIIWATGGSIPQGVVVGPDSQYGPLSTRLLGTSEQIAAAQDKRGNILFWGKIVYRDAFKERRETGFCKRYDFIQGGFRLAYCHELNYYT